MADIIKVKGLKELHAALEKLQAKVQSTVMGRALSQAAVPVVAAAATNAARHRRAAEGRGYKDRDSVKLHETIGQRVRSYKDGGLLYLAAGPLLKQGGFHGHLVEFGHRIVTGGTLEGEKRKPEMTAAGKRFLAGLGLTYGSQARLRKSKKTGKLVRGSRRGYIASADITKEQMKAISGGRTRTGIVAGKLYGVGKKFRGQIVRGGGKLQGGRTRPFPFMGPAWNQTGRACLGVFVEELRNGIDKAAKESAAKGPVA